MKIKKRKTGNYLSHNYDNRSEEYWRNKCSCLDKAYQLMKLRMYEAEGKALRYEEMSKRYMQAFKQFCDDCDEDPEEYIAGFVDEYKELFPDKSDETPNPWDFEETLTEESRKFLEAPTKTFKDYKIENADVIEEMLSYCINDEQKISVMDLYREEFYAGDDKAKRDIVHEKFNKLTDEIEASRKRNNN